MPGAETRSLVAGGCEGRPVLGGWSVCRARSGCAAGFSTAGLGRWPIADALMTGIGCVTSWGSATTFRAAATGPGRAAGGTGGGTRFGALGPSFSPGTRFGKDAGRSGEVVSLAAAGTGASSAGARGSGGGDSASGDCLTRIGGLGPSFAPGTRFGKGGGRSGEAVSLAAACPGPSSCGSGGGDSASSDCAPPGACLSPLAARDTRRDSGGTRLSSPIRPPPPGHA